MSIFLSENTIIFTLEEDTRAVQLSVSANYSDSGELSSSLLGGRYQKRV